MKRLWMVVCAALWLATAAAQKDADFKPLTSTDELVQVIDSATQEILVAAPALNNTAVAQALHQASFEKGVSVLVLMPLEAAAAKTSYANSLVAGYATVHNARIEAVSVLVVDRKYLVRGPLLSLTRQRFE